MISSTDLTSRPIFTLLSCISCRMDWVSSVAWPICTEFSITRSLVSLLEAFSSLTASACLAALSARVWLALAICWDADATDMAILMILANIKSLD